MSDDKKNMKSSFSKKAIDASKVIMGAIAVKAADELTKIMLKYPKRPENTSRTEFTKKVKPTRTYVQAARKINYWSKHPESIPKSEGEPKSWVDRAKNEFFGESRPHPTQSYFPSSIMPGIDGVVSFSVVLVPFAIVLGIINLLFPDFPDVILLWVLFIYILFIAIPAAYLGLDAIRDGTKALLLSSGETIRFGIKSMYFFFKILIQGIVEIFTIMALIIYDFVIEYWLLIISYIVSFALLYAIITIITPNLSFFGLLMLVAIPSLLPASILHRTYLIYRYNRKMAK